MGHSVLDNPLFVVLLVFTVLTVVLDVILQYRVRDVAHRGRRERNRESFTSAISSIRYVLATDRMLLIAIMVSGLGLFVSWELFSMGQPLLGAALSALAFIASLAKTLTLGATRGAETEVGGYDVGRFLKRRRTKAGMTASHSEE